MQDIIEVIRVQKRKSPVRDEAINDLKVRLKRIFKNYPNIKLVTLGDLGLEYNKVKGNYRLDYVSKIKYTWLTDNGCEFGDCNDFGDEMFEEDEIHKAATAIKITSVKDIIEDNHLIKA